MKIRIRPSAWVDIEESMAHLKEQAGIRTATQFYHHVRQTLRELSRQPGLGRRRTDLKQPGIRSWRVSRPFENWLVFYLAEIAGLDILRIKHGAVDVSSLFRR